MESYFEESAFGEKGEQGRSNGHVLRDDVSWRERSGLETCRRGTGKANYLGRTEYLEKDKTINKSRSLGRSGLT
jgi:hypothetical protein